MAIAWRWKALAKKRGLANRSQLSTLTSARVAGRLIANSCGA